MQITKEQVNELLTLVETIGNASSRMAALILTVVTEAVLKDQPKEETDEVTRG